MRSGVLATQCGLTKNDTAVPYCGNNDDYLRMKLGCIGLIAACCLAGFDGRETGEPNPVVLEKPRQLPPQE